MKKGLDGVPTEVKWLVQVTPPGSLIGYDPRQIPFTTMKAYRDELRAAEAALNPSPAISEIIAPLSRHLVAVNGSNLVDLVWEEMKNTGEELSVRPVRTSNPVYTVPVSFAGETWQQKVRRVLDRMSEHGASLLVLAALDEIAWLLNLRGSDIPFSPIFFAYGLLSTTELKLFLGSKTVSTSEDILQHLSDSNLKVIRKY